MCEVLDNIHLLCFVWLSCCKGHYWRRVGVDFISMLLQICQLTRSGPPPPTYCRV